MNSFSYLNLGNNIPNNNTTINTIYSNLEVINY
jgi:hypothetical protein